MRFAWKVFLGAIAVVAITTLVVERLATTDLQERRLEQIDAGLRDDAAAVAELARPLLAGADRLALQRLADALAGPSRARRITLLGPAGAVLADSHESHDRMESHAHRPEVRRPGEVVQRQSSTLDRPLRYVAERVLGPEGELLGYARVAVSAEGIQQELTSLGRAIQLSALVALLVGLVLSLLLARRLSAPLERVRALLGALGRGEQPERLPVESHDELGRLAMAANETATRLQRRHAALAEQVTQKEAVLSAMEEGVLSVDADERVVLANSAARRWLTDPHGDPVGRRLTEVTRVPEILQAAARATRRDERVETEFRLDLPGEGARIVGLSANPVEASEGPQVAVMVLRDLTEIRRLEKVRTDFVANVSHELKTPLTSMRGFVEAVLEDPQMPPERRSRFLQKAYINTQRLTDIVSDLLDLARIESHPPDAPQEPVDLGQLVAECVRRAASDAETRGVQVRLHPSERPLRVLGDRRALSTAVDNLLSNAVKYSPRGHPVTVSLWGERANAWIEVADEGPGIAPHEQERIFERFYRVDKDRSRALGGTGLGLSIVRNVARAHGGEVSVQSALGAGSAFRLRLPAA